jgi:serine phosphatase RsbU (regulator of sigma subunit)
MPTIETAHLAVVNPSGQRTRCALSASPFLFGRHSDNNLVLRDNRISRVHGRILEQDGAHIIEDMQSRAGTYLNGNRITSPVKLHHGDSVTFGVADGYQLIYLREDHDITRLADRMTTTAGRTQAPGNLGKLSALVEVARALQDALSLREVLESIVDAALAVTRSERGFLLLKHGGELRLEVARDSQGLPLAESDLKVPTRLIQRALNNRRELLSMHFDPNMADAEQPDQSVMRLDLRSVVCVPLVRIRSNAASNETMVSSGQDTAGLLYLDSRIDLADLSSGNREILQALAIEASTILENARLLEQDRARHRLEDELRIARHLQQDLLPASLPKDGWLRAAASTVPSQLVGGDYYDAIALPGGWWNLVVADVSGKGVGSALLAGLLQGAFLLAPTSATEIVAMFERLNRYLYERTEGEKYATIFHASIHESGRMLWSNAAHCPPIVLHAGGAHESLKATSMAVGMLDFARYEVRETQLLPGDRLIVYSDGFSEAQNAGGQYFDDAHIRLVLNEGQGLGAQDLHGLLNAAVQRFTGGVPQRDDMTLLVAEYAPSGR